MPAFAQKKDGKWRVVDKSGVVKNKKGNPVDGGGFESQEKAKAQARAINANDEAFDNVRRGRAARITRENRR